MDSVANKLTENQESGDDKPNGYERNKLSNRARVKSHSTM